MRHVANINTPERVYPVQLVGYNSYEVPGIGFTTKQGKVRGCRGCRDEREAFRTAKQLARLAGRDVSKWKLELL